MTKPSHQSHPCSRPDCAAPSRARGMCKNHYDAWRRALPTPLGKHGNNQEIKAAMPGTVAELADRCEMKYDTASKSVSRMHGREEIHIDHWQPPEPGQGHRWVAVFIDGAGEDAKMPKWKKRQYARARCCARYAEQRGKQKFDPLVAALFGARKQGRADGAHQDN